MNREQTVKWLLAAFVALMTFFVYIPALQNGFVSWDDGYYIYRNPHIRSLKFIFFKWAFFSFYISNWHPLTWVTHAIDYAFWGLIPAGHHLTNIVLHGFNAFLVVLLILRLLDRNRSVTALRERAGRIISDKGILTAAGITGLLFGIHPIHVESVAWVAERKDVLYAFFYLLSLLTYIRYIKETGEVGTHGKHFSILLNRHYGLTLILFILSLMSKPMAVTLPVVLLILDWYPFRRFERGRIGYILMEKLPFLLLAIGSAIITFQAQHLGESVRSYTDVPLSPRILIGLQALTGYLSKMIFPINLSPFYPYPQNVNMVTLLSYKYSIPFLLVTGITIVCFIFLKRQKIWFAVWGYYLVTLLPVLGVIQVGNQAMADRYTYLPSIGPFLLIGLGAAWVTDRRLAISRLDAVKGTLSLFVVALLVGVLSYATIRQVRVWENDETLWSKVIAVYPGNLLAHYNRGVFYRDTKQHEKAIYDFTRVIKLNPDFAEAHNNLGMAYGLKGSIDKAIKHFKLAIKIKPYSPEAYINLGYAYYLNGWIDEAIVQYINAIELQPANAKAHNNLSNAYRKKGLLDKAEEHLRISKRLKKVSWR